MRPSSSIFAASSTLIRQVERGGRTAMVEVVAGDALVLSQLTPDAVQHPEIAPARPILAVFKSIGVQVL